MELLTTLPEPSKNKALFNLLYTLNEETRSCLKQEWDNLRWNSGRYAMGNSIVHIDVNTLKVDGKEYELTPGLRMLILY